MTAVATLEMPETTTQPAAPAPAGLDRLVLTGYMGSGKSTVGRLLADRLGWNFLDLDHEIEHREGRTVPQIFAESGEPHFRRLESSTLASLLGRRRVVIALGGGAPEELGNRLLLEQTPRTAVVFLAAPLQTLIDRCRIQAAEPGATARPVLADLVTAARRFDLRRRHYERIATHTLDTTRQSVDQTLNAILDALPTHP